MLHVNILAGAILKFIKVRTYGTDPVHLEFTKFKGLVLLSSECWDEESKKKFFFLSFENVLYIKHPGLAQQY